MAKKKVIHASKEMKQAIKDFERRHKK